MELEALPTKFEGHRFTRNDEKNAALIEWLGLKGYSAVWVKGDLEKDETSWLFIFIGPNTLRVNLGEWVVVGAGGDLFTHYPEEFKTMFKVLD